MTNEELRAEAEKQGLILVRTEITEEDAKRIIKEAVSQYVGEDYFESELELERFKERKIKEMIEKIVEDGWSCTVLSRGYDPFLKG